MCDRGRGCQRACERRGERDEVWRGPDFGDDEPCGWGQILFMTGCAGNRAEGKRGGVI